MLSDEIYEGLDLNDREAYERRIRIKPLRGGQGAVQAWMRERDRLVEELIDARAELATALGLLRLDMRLHESFSDAGHVEVVELRLNRSLQAMDATLGSLGSPMA